MNVRTRQEFMRNNLLDIIDDYPDQLIVIIEELVSHLNHNQLDQMEDLIVNNYADEEVAEVEKCIVETNGDYAECVDHLLETYREMRYDSNGGDNEDFSVLAFIKKIWEDDVTGACAGTHNFIFQMPNSVGRVIDVDFNGTEPLNVHTLKIQD